MQELGGGFYSRGAHKARTRISMQHPLINSSNYSVQLRTVSSVFVNEICTFSGANTSACVTVEY